MLERQVEKNIIIKAKNELDRTQHSQIPENYLITPKCSYKISSWVLVSFLLLDSGRSLVTFFCAGLILFDLAVLLVAGLDLGGGSRPRTRPTPSVSSRPSAYSQTAWFQTKIRPAPKKSDAASSLVAAKTNLHPALILQEHLGVMK